MQPELRVGQFYKPMCACDPSDVYMVYNVTDKGVDMVRQNGELRTPVFAFFYERYTWLDYVAWKPRESETPVFAFDPKTGVPISSNSVAMAPASPPPKMRYYKNPNGFADPARVHYLKRDPDGAVTMHPAGEKWQATWGKIDDEIVADGMWVEITEKEALAMLPPNYVPWTFETMPVAVKVKWKSNINRLRLATPKTDDMILIAGNMDTYRRLFEQYVQLDGSPCGEKVSAT